MAASLADGSALDALLVTLLRSRLPYAEATMATCTARTPSTDPNGKRCGKPATRSFLSTEGMMHLCTKHDEAFYRTAIQATRVGGTQAEEQFSEFARAWAAPEDQALVAPEGEG